MSIIKCLECQKEISDKSENCIHCGYPVKLSIENGGEHLAGERITQEQNDTESQPLERADRKRGKIFKIKYIVLIIIGILLIASVTGTWYILNEQNKIKTEISSRDVVVQNLTTEINQANSQLEIALEIAGAYDYLISTIDEASTNVTKHYKTHWDSSTLYTFGKVEIEINKINSAIDIYMSKNYNISQIDNALIEYSNKLDKLVGVEVYDIVGILGKINLMGLETQLIMTKFDTGNLLDVINANKQADNINGINKKIIELDALIQENNSAIVKLKEKLLF